MIRKREFFDEPDHLSPAWTLTKDGRVAICEVWSHEHGFELRLTYERDPLPRTQVCRDTEELVTFQASWRRALEEQGWTKLGAP